MKRSKFQRWFGQMPNLSRGQAQQVRDALGPGHPPAAPEALQWLAALPIPGCPRCQAEHPYRWGHQAGLQRYRCRQCRHTFTALSGTPLARLRHKAHWLTYSEALREGLSVRRAAARCGIDKTTSFRWRHRFLTRPAEQKAERLSGIVEADETFFPHSCKGQRPLDRPPRQRGKQIRTRGTGKDQVPVLVVRDRSGATADFQLTVSDTQAVKTRLRPLLAPDAILCSDGAAIYRNAAHDLGITHRPVNLSKGIRVIASVYHIQNVNAYDSRLKAWMRRFHGVATKYLDHYLGWRRWLERGGEHGPPCAGLSAALGWENPFQLILQT
jgi:transposase-like protein